MRHIPALAVTMVFCSIGQASRAAERDPVPTFKEFVSTASAVKAWSVVAQNSKNKQWMKQYYAVGEVKFDVKKTDSLLRPVEGVTNFPISITRSSFYATPAEAAASSDVQPDRITEYFSGKYFFEAGEWRVDRYTYRVAFFDQKPDPGVIAIDRDQLSKAIADQNLDGRLLQAWFK